MHLTDEDKEIIANAAKEALEWLDDNQSATKEEFESQWIKPLNKSWHRQFI